MTRSRTKTAATAALPIAMVVALTACNAEPAEQDDANGELEAVTVGFIPSWTDGLSTGYLVANQLEEMGYPVEIEALTDNGPLYAALAQGDVDVYTSAWPEVTHREMYEQYEDELEPLGDGYYSNSVLSLAVPEYSEIQSIEDLPQYADVLGKQIIGIEPGAGLTGVVKDEVIPTYGLDDWELLTSSTTGMLAELEAATDAQEEIVVTMWRPFWAATEYGLRDLEDPEGAFGDSESLYFLANAEWATENPEAAEWLGSVQLDDEQFGTLEDKVVNEFGEGQEAEAIESWLQENPDVLPALPSP